VLNSDEGGDLSDFITNGEWYLIGKLTITVVALTVVGFYFFLFFVSWRNFGEYFKVTKGPTMLLL
jgi:hypothetical protein